MLSTHAGVALIADVIPSEEENQFIYSRAQVCYGIEGMNGGRIGELVDSGQGHGVVTLPKKMSNSLPN